MRIAGPLPFILFRPPRLSGRPAISERKSAMETVRIFDTTLRDGEQSPGATLDLPEKLEIARQLELLGVDIIEAGFPISSQGDFESVKAIAATLTKASVCGLSRCTPKDIERTGEAVKNAAKPPSMSSAPPARSTAITSCARARKTSSASRLSR